MKRTVPPFPGGWSDPGPAPITINGDDGDNALYAFQSVAATLYGNGGDDYLFTGNGDDKLFGGDGSDILVSYDGTDLLKGGRGADHLYAYGGGDADLWGGNGKDRFYFQFSNDKDAVIQDWDDLDKLVLSEGSQYTTSVVSGNLVVQFGDNTITIQGVTSLDSNDIVVI